MSWACSNCAWEICSADWADSQIRSRLIAIMVNKPYLHIADDGPIAQIRSAIWLKCLKPSRWCQSRSFRYSIYCILINFILSLKIHHHVLLIAVITGYEPRPDLQISPISWANIPCAIWASTRGEWIISINQKQFQRSFIESRFLDLLKSKSNVRQCPRKSTKQIFCPSRKAH